MGKWDNRGMAKKGGGKAKAMAVPGKEDREGHGKHGVVSSESLERLAEGHVAVAKDAQRLSNATVDPMYMTQLRAVAMVHDQTAHILREEAVAVRKLYVRWGAK